MTVVSRPEFAGSGLSVAAYRGARYRGASGAEEVAETVLAALAEAAAPALVYGYHADLDRTGHLCGVDSDAWRVAVSDVGRLLTRVVEGLPPDAALLVTADHGQLDVPADTR
jgi:predicted AlkP superfamily pyrophosphatase or phosphodiesterase